MCKTRQAAIRRSVPVSLQLANLPIQKIDLRRAGGIFGCRPAAFKNASRAVQKLLHSFAELSGLRPLELPSDRSAAAKI